MNNAEEGRLMDKDVVAKRITDLEEELASLKSIAAPPRPLSLLRRLPGFLLTYWVLLSFAGAIVTAVFAKYAFHYDFFEQYEDAARKKQISELHSKLGDRLLARAQWEGAADAYGEALKVNPHNVQATVGLAAARVFLPSGRQKYAFPDIVDVKLQHLRELDPPAPLYIVRFLEGARNIDKGDYKAARESLLASISASIAEKKEFAGGHIYLAYVEQKQRHLEAAIEHNRKAVELDPQNPDALNNLGFLYVVTGRYDEAVKYLSDSYSISPALLTGINLGDALRYRRQFKQAMQMHELVLQSAKRVERDYDPFWSPGGWLYNYMPQDGDSGWITRSIDVQTTEQKLAILHLALALDYAINGAFPEAERELREALKLEDGKAFRAFYVNKISSLQTLPGLDAQGGRWLAKYRAELPGP
jgi:tetratricopeptide (TPR) repeat protein